MQNIQTLIQAAKSTRLAKAPAQPDHLNRAGAPSFTRPLKEQVLQVLMTGTLSDAFYASGGELAAEALEVLAKARTECPEFLARAVVYAREQGFMKTLPVLGLAVLSGGRGRTKALFEASFPRVIRTPDDLRAFTALCRSGAVTGRKGFGGVARTAVRAHLGTLSEYHAVKYGSAASREVTLRDVIRMAHPRPATPAMAERFGWLVGGVEKLGENPALNPRIRAFESLKRATDESEVAALVRQGGLPYEAVVPAVRSMTPAIWSELLRQAPYMNLLRNLVTFTRHGVFADEANVRYAVERLTDPAAIAKAMVLPFRFFEAWKRYEETDGRDSRIADALRVALERSFVNLPSLGDRTVCIGTDVSGSMSMGTISPKSSTRYVDIAGVFTGALLRKCEGRVIPLPFDTAVHADCGISGRDDILVTADKIARYEGGGTAVGAPAEYLLKRKLKVDTFIGITDSEDWAYGRDGYGYGCSASFIDLWRTYRKTIAPDAKAFLVTIAPYRDAVAPSGEGVSFIYGWSDRVPGYIARTLAAGESQVADVERMPLGIAEDSAEAAETDPASDEGGEPESE